MLNYVFNCKAFSIENYKSAVRTSSTLLERTETLDSLASKATTVNNINIVTAFWEMVQTKALAIGNLKARLLYDQRRLRCTMHDVLYSHVGTKFAKICILQVCVQNTWKLLIMH